jgi:hypothetical protein
MQLRINKFSHNIKTILIAILTVPISLLTLVTTLDQDVLKMAGVNSIKAEQILLVDGKTFTLSTKNNLHLTAPGLSSSSTSKLTANIRDNNSDSQVLTWKNESNNRGWLFINGTSKVIVMRYVNNILIIRVEEYTNASDKKLLIKSGPTLNSFYFVGGGYPYEDRALTFGSNNAQVSVEGLYQNNSGQILSINYLNVAPVKKDNFKILIPDNKVLSLKTKSNLYLTAKGYSDASSSRLYSNQKNSNSNNQIFTWRNKENNRGWLFINGTSKIIAVRNINNITTLQVEDYRNSGEQTLEIYPGYSPSSYHITGGSYPYGDSAISFINSNNEVKINEYNQEIDTQKIYIEPIDGVSSTTGTNINKILIKDNSILNIGTKGLFNISAENAVNTRVKIATKNKNDLKQKFKWKNDSNSIGRGWLFLNGTNKIITIRNLNGITGLQVEEFVNNYEQRLDIYPGFSPGTLHFSGGAYPYENQSVTIQNHLSSSSAGEEISTTDYNQNNNDQIFYIEYGQGIITPPPIVIEKYKDPIPPGKPNAPLIPTDYIFTMAAKHGWGVDGNKYKTSKTKRAFAYPRNKADPEQVIKWQPAGSKDTGYLRLNGTDLTWVALNGSGGRFLTLQKYNGTEAQRWDVKKIPGVNDAYHLMDRSSKKVITINPENGYDVHVDPIVLGDIRQYMVINKIK